MEELRFDNILGEQDIDTLFLEPEEDPQDEEKKDPEGNEDPKGKDTTTEEVDPDNLFEEEQAKGKQPGSVGSDGDNEGKGKEDTTPGGQDDGTSPNENFYSSIANACAVDGAFPNLDDETVRNVKTAEDYYHLIDLEVEARLNDTQKRIKQALDNGVEASDIRKYENTLRYVNSLTDENIMEESEKGENLRRSLIYQDFMNKGYSAERAQKLTQRTIDAGTDVEDAKDALLNNKEFFQAQYNKLLKDAQEEAEKEKAERKAESERLRESILKDKQLLGDIELDKNMRQKAFDAISKPVYKDPETGEYYTALQKFEMEHRGDFLKIAGLMYALTNGFKDFDGFTKGKVKKEVRKGLAELEQSLHNQRRGPGGNLSFVTTVKDDPESYIGKGLKLDL